ncbi:MAG: hypothetical protein WDZ80_04465 [Candidatus Paceibacterota bacterium]
MNKEEKLKINILEYIDSISPEELYRTTKGVQISGFDKKEVTYKAYELQKEGLIEAAVSHHDLGVERVIPRGLTSEGRKALEEYRKNWLQKLFPLYKEKFREQLADSFAKGTLIIILIFIGYLLRYLQEVLF